MKIKGDRVRFFFSQRIVFDPYKIIAIFCIRCDIFSHSHHCKMTAKTTPVHSIIKNSIGLLETLFRSLAIAYIQDKASFSFAALK